jgi:hypothetical protein
VLLCLVLRFAEGSRFTRILKEYEETERKRRWGEEDGRTGMMGTSNRTRSIRMNRRYRRRKNRKRRKRDRQRKGERE